MMKLNLTTGIIPSLNVFAGLLGLFFVKTWTQFLSKFGLLRQPFTGQENTIIQTCVVASSGIAFSGGFGSYLFGMSEKIAIQSGDTKLGFKDPSLGWITGFLFIVSFLGLLSVVPLIKIMIIDFKLTYPSGTATAHLINSFHTAEGAKLAKQVTISLNICNSSRDDCGFIKFPTFGLKARDYKFFFDFSATYIGVGMICPYIINVSVLLGGILSWGIMWPLIETRKGDWFSSDLSQSSLHGLQGYKVFIAIAMTLGDGLYNFFKVLSRTLAGLFHQFQARNVRSGLSMDNSPPDYPKLSYDDQRRTRIFLKDQIPTWFAIAGYVIIAVVSIATLPHIFPELKWYFVLVIYVFAPTLAFCNAYGCGLTDWSLASTYEKLAIFTIGAWAGSSHGGVLAGLTACGVMMNIVSTACDLTQDFKTGYMTLASPRSMFVSQVIGTAMGCIISPCGSEYPAPFAIVFRNMAKLGVEGFSSLPKDCLLLCYVLFGAAILVNLIKDYSGKMGRFIPLPMAMAIPFYLGPYFAIDMCVGSLILFVWEKTNKEKAEAFGPAVASGLICGDGIWTLPSSILALAGVQPPICMKFLSRGANVRVDKFLLGSST
ncbi:hypothetical protein ACOSP7_023896 [Xanthoceras sorbifolium]